MDIPSLFMIPSAVSSGKVHSVFPNSTDADFDFARSSTATRVNSNGLIESVASGQARLNYEIEGALVNTKPSLLLEPQSTNLVTYSEDYTQSVWAKENITVTSNAVISPDGTQNASILTDTSTNGQHRITTSTLFSADGNNRVFSVFVKKGTSRYCAINHVAGFTSSVNTVIFDFDTASYVATGRSDYIDEVFTPKHYGNGWYKISFRSDLNTAAYNRLSIGLSNGTSYTDTNYAGTGATVFVWGGQVEQQSYCTSYIPTNGSTQTRSGETCNGAGTSSILPSEEGILYVEAKALVDGLSAREISLSSGSSSNAIRLRYSSDVSRFQAFMRSGGGTIQALSRSAKPQDVYRKIAIEYNSTEFAMWIDGTKEATVATTSTPIGLSELEFYLNSSFPFYGKIRDIRVYNTKEMTDSEVDILLTKITS